MGEEHINTLKAHISDIKWHRNPDLSSEQIARLEVSIDALTAENAELRKLVEALEGSLRNMRRYCAVQGRLDDGEELVGLAYDGSIWGPCADPKYEMYELAENVEEWLHNKIDTALTQRKEGSDVVDTK